MRSMLGVATIALGATTATAPVLAQTYETPASAAQVSAPPAAQPPGTVVPTAPLPLCQAGISKGARNALIALQTAVVAKNNAAVPALVAAAQASAKSNDDKCFIAQMQMKAALDSSNLPGVAAAIAAQQASGAVPAARIATLYEDLGRLQYKAAAFADASTSFEQSIKLAPNNGSAVVMLAETRAKQERIAEALPLYQKAIATELAAGRKPEESWYKRSVAVAYGARNPLAYGLARDWVRAYPTTKNWREAIVLYGQLSRTDDGDLIDLYRLQRLNRALVGDSDFGRYAQIALDRGFPGEAKGALDEGFAASAIARSQPTLKALHAQATAKSAGDRASLAGQAQTALAGSQAKPAMALGEAFFGYGDYAKAAELFRAARAKTGADTGLADLRLGMALAAAGDKAGATAALKLVQGPRAEIAQYWLAYVAMR